ncbi:MAG: hypothetical protein ACXWQO_05765 [Bdellovibrionota bacterium]
MSLRFFCISLLAFLVAGCGNSPKQALSKTGGHDSAPTNPKPCEGSYNPISLFIPGAMPVTELENLPAGTYTGNGMEFYANDDQGDAGSQQVHFQEVMMEGAIMMRPVCHTVIDPASSAEYDFPALNVLTVSDKGVKSREDIVYQILNNRNHFTTGKAIVPGLVASGMTSLMAKFTQARLYRIGPTLYELHGEVQTHTVNGLISKWVQQRILFTPPESN